MMHKIYILLPVHNRKDITTGFINCLKRQTFNNFQLVVIDDGSTDGTSECIKEIAPTAIVLKGDGNLWWAGGLQLGLDWLKKNVSSPDDIVLMINDDVSFSPSFLDHAARIMKDAKRCMIQATICDIDSHEVLDRGIFFDESKLLFNHIANPKEVNCLTTNGLFVKYEDLEEIGGFFPKILPHYLSDYEYTIRAGRKGFSLRVDESLELYWDKNTTGVHEFCRFSFMKFISTLFSKRSSANPFYWTIFVFLTCRLNNIPINILRVWVKCFRLILHVAMTRLKGMLS